MRLSVTKLVLAAIACTSWSATQLEAKPRDWPRITARAPPLAKVAAVIFKLVKAASSSSIGSRSPVAAQANMFLAISARLPGVRMAVGNDSTA